MQDNRYAPTQGALNSQQTAQSGDPGQEPASRSRRLLNLVIDSVASILLSIVIGVALTLVWPQIFVGIDEDPSIGLNYLLGAIVGLIYYLPFEMLTGRTLGKLVTGTKVVSTSGAPLTFLQVVGRTLARYIPFEAFTFLRSSRVGLHDQLSNTRVVSVRST